MEDEAEVVREELNVQASLMNYSQKNCWLEINEASSRKME